MIGAGAADPVGRRERGEKKSERRGRDRGLSIATLDIHGWG